ncbi:Type I secretion outer membrane protein (plasmid) [Mycetohabitans rhizoxinica HKI 454]|uniref:Type I secretion outer membrane protein n=1 Tax=Mycetohabitans rhizoxinica (strain DSM 19002 / CIP 109453 / HKI 454) TaxID=882378 RepID=E5AU36_MYCRK|nr:efflux transporter outer membrane subunit [Mycetohabitans rhizoxinica]CBW76610.1 Type I secretion outer membrane protein [Mycetohabitans rhizoxinica HKI 454]
MMRRFPRVLLSPMSTPEPVPSLFFMSRRWPGLRASPTCRIHPCRVVNRRAALATTACVAAACATLLGGCAFAPSERPAPPAPPHYAAQPGAAQSVTAAGVAQRFALGARAVPRWWMLYQSDALNAWVDEGLRNNATLAAAEKTLAAAREQLHAQIGESMLPSIDAGGQVQRQRALGMPIQGPPTLRYNTFVGQIRANYTIDLFGAARLANQAVSRRVDVQSYQFDAARRTLAANIVSAALAAASLHEQWDAQARIAALAAAEADDTDKRVALGAASQVDALNARQSAQAAAAAVPPLRAQWLAARHALAVLMGRTPDAAPEDLPLDRLTLPDTVPVSLPSTLLHERPDVLAADAAVQAAAAEVGVATAQMFPSLTLSASWGQGGLSWPLATRAAGRLWNLGAGLTQPLFHGSALRAQRRAALHAYDAALDQYRQTVLNAFRDVADTLVALEQDARTQAAALAAQQAAEQATQVARQRYESGALPISAVRASEQQTQSTRIHAVRARAARLANTASLFQAMGSPAVDTSAQR